ncbi:FMRFamide receptor-like [Argopecten irradians]|uniref:FMRFamide receptor-like n=1 Tax=Argopecten irradians TaxID=31199 RepID=UPI00371733D1
MENISSILDNRYCNSTLWNSSMTSNHAVTSDNISLCNFSSAADQPVGSVVDDEIPWFFLYLIPIISSFGLVGNILSFVVMKNLSATSSFYVYTAALTLVDSAVLIIGGFLFWMDRLKLVDIFISKFHFYCSPIAISNMVFSQYSNWITMALCVDRYIAVCHPLKVKRFCTKKRAIITMICMFMVKVALNFPMACFQWNADYTACSFPEKPIAFCVEYLVITAVPTKYFVPFTVIFVFSALIIRGLYIAKKHRKRLSNELSSNGRKMNATTLKTMFLFMGIVLFHFVRFLPATTVVRKYLTFVGKWDLQTFPFTGDKLKTINVANHALNFVIYCLSGTRFRSALLRLVCRRRAL